MENKESGLIADVISWLPYWAITIAFLILYLLVLYFVGTYFPESIPDEMYPLVVLAFPMTILGAGPKVLRFIHKRHIKKQKIQNTFIKNLKDLAPNAVFHNKIEVRDELVYNKNSSTLFTGILVEWFSNGEKMSEANYVNGREEGLFTTWHNNGQKAYEHTRINGQLEGVMKGWHSNGMLAHETSYVNGEAGSEKSWDENGNEIDDEIEISEIEKMKLHEQKLL
jgi:hypothetical protein